MFYQLTIATTIIAFFILKLFLQKRKKQINKNEFIFWLAFWLIVLVLILSLKPLDRVVSSLGFTANSLEVLLYLSVAVLTYFIFRIRLRLSKMESDISKIVDHIALNKK